MEVTGLVRLGEPPIPHDSTLCLQKYHFCTRRVTPSAGRLRPPEPRSPDRPRVRRSTGGPLWWCGRGLLETLGRREWGRAVRRHQSRGPPRLRPCPLLFGVGCRHPSPDTLTESPTTPQSDDLVARIPRRVGRGTFGGTRVCRSATLREEGLLHSSPTTLTPVPVSREVDDGGRTE